jgi:hypothetical protein
MRSGPDGRLYGSVTAADLADEIWRTRKIRVDRRKIGVDTIKRIGRYSITIDVFEGVTADLKLLVVPEGGELPPEEELAAMEAAEAAAAAEAAVAAAPASAEADVVVEEIVVAEEIDADDSAVVEEVSVEAEPVLDEAEPGEIEEPADEA